MRGWIIKFDMGQPASTKVSLCIRGPKGISGTFAKSRNLGFCESKTWVWAAFLSWKACRSLLKYARMMNIWMVASGEKVRRGEVNFSSRLWPTLGFGLLKSHHVPYIRRTTIAKTKNPISSFPNMTRAISLM